jgi:hypothetical protein
VYARVGIAVVDVSIAIVTFPPGFAITRVAICIICAAAVYARVGIAVVDVGNFVIAMVTLPPGFAVTRVAILFIRTAAV